MRHKLLVLTVQKFYNRCTFTEVIAKLKLGYRFLDHPVDSGNFFVTFQYIWLVCEFVAML